MLLQPLFTTVAPLILASSSPRRRQMLQTMGLSFTVVPAAVDETPLPGEPPPDFAHRMASAKAQTVATRNPDSWILAADTVVTLDGLILGKPRDRKEALTILRRLSGRTHQVVSAISLCSPARGVAHTETDTTGVSFIAAPDELLAAYVATGEPMDKAGAYGIQGAGAFLVRRIEGSCANVIGLPIDRAIALLLCHKIIIPAASPSPAS
ncbi:MAG: septum formation protein Maf [Desulfobulbus sp.]|nr:MAG: septum formation protein Maf [Desulfobulbus sp.]